jgi:hypothetical protein
LIGGQDGGAGQNEDHIDTPVSPISAARSSCVERFTTAEQYVHAAVSVLVAGSTFQVKPEPLEDRDRRQIAGPDRGEHGVIAQFVETASAARASSVA